MSPTARSAKKEAEAIRGGDRKAMAKAITLLESKRPEKAERGREILEELVPYTGQSMRVGVTGPPGVGKSTFIESLGIYLLERGHQVAVLAVDPSSPVTGGSILGDKTRMERLAQEADAFIRPSPSGGSLGGVAERTREAMLVCEAAGYDVVIVETVGIGQSEVTVRSMVDFFLVLLQPGAGDELQGIKKGVLELADSLVVNKADGDQLEAAERSAGEHKQALGLLHARSANWTPRVLMVSSLHASGIDGVWEAILAHTAALEASGERQTRRKEQARQWMWSLVEEGLRSSFRSHPDISNQIDALERAVQELEISPAAAARTLLDAFRS
ncbi:MAG: methylmalonyl Co-A mutase-associated GTPase MeaB [Myxococcales bacterium]|nr:methylmalonyl Co-A mutase-associated GTPase MeaB [Myxococcales bacterium]